MLKKQKVLVMLLIVLLIMPLISSVNRQNTDLVISHAVRVDGKPESTTSCNITLKDPDKIDLVLSQNMTFNISTQEHQYFLDGSNLSKIGSYTYVITCNFQTSWQTDEFDLPITPSGRTSSISESVLYFLFVIVMFGILLTMFYFIFTLPSENDRDNEGTVIYIVKLKYLRVFLIAMTYPVIIIILNLMNGLSVNFVSLTIFSGLFGFLFEIFLRSAWIFTVVMIVWIFVMLVKDSNIRGLIKKMQHPLPL
jgi:hypothetical protein